MSATAATTGFLVLDPREVPLGGPRAMTVRRTLPHKDRTSVGPWIFADHYGPDDVAVSGGMDVAPHPHTGLATVSWLFAGEVTHDDSAGVHAAVLPGEMNLMTAGRGIAHSEVSTPDTTTLHGLQLWLAYPRAQRAGGAKEVARGFQHFVPSPVTLPGGAVAKVFVGELAGVAEAEVVAPKQALGVEIVFPTAATTTLALDEALEHAILVDQGSVTVTRGDTGAAASPLIGGMAICDPGVSDLEIAAHEANTRVILIGGQPFGEPIVMFWNFVGTDHEDVALARADWENTAARQERYGDVPGYVGHATGPDKVMRIPAPPVPRVRLKSRRNPDLTR